VGKIDPLQPPINEGIHFFAELYGFGIGYSALNTARSALSSVIVLPENITFGCHPLVSRFMKGVFELRPSLPKYNEVWDVSVILSMLKN
jgi:hypothetical protein